MPHWLIKSGIQRVISWLPASVFFNEVIQRCFSRSLVLAYPNFQGKLAAADKFLKQFRECQPLSPGSFTALEVGTGWYPTFPLAFYLCGASETWTFDIVGYLTPGRIALILEYFSRADQDGSLRKLLPSLQPERVGRLLELRKFVEKEPPADCLARLNIHVRVQDACQCGLPSGSVDFIYSNSVLEYIPAALFPKLLAEFRRVASPRSAMVHFTYFADQFAYFDRSITRFNFLQYSDEQWKWRESPLVSVNRFRITDHRMLLARAGFELKAEENQNGSLADLKTVRLAPRFQPYPTADLLVLATTLTAVPSAVPPGQ